MSTRAQAVLDEIKTLPPHELQVLWQELQRLVTSTAKVPPVDDPIRSARGMFAGSGLTKALLASREEERRRG